MDEQTIFTMAIEKKSPAEREKYLDQACAGNAELRGSVDRLLKAYEKAGAFLEDAPPVIAATIDQPAIVEQPGSMIGPYHLRKELGEGGMGAVFMATQKEPIRRKVALKVIKPGMDSKQVVNRFEAERQALAMMDHPNIARVIDGGTTESGRPYFVMELVKGMPVTGYCDRYRLTTDDRLALFSDVCSAVQHAHQKGIIHRDLKPSNILVTQLDGKAIPKVIDFGIAKAISGRLTDDSFVTGHAQMVGTPLYMSPEQADLSAVDVDTRSDIYSLGVLLYELLTGTTPFDGERMSSVSFDEFRRIVREEDPPRPSMRLSTLDAALETVADKYQTDPRTLSHELSGELDWIVMKALEKDRTRRYESASDFAKDIQRHLEDEPVEACPPSTAYRMGKFYRRNRFVLLAVSAVALALIVGAGIAGWQAVVATRAKGFAKEQQGLAEQRLVDVDEQRTLAEKNFQLAFDAVDQMLSDVASNQLENVPQAEPIRKALLEKALTFFVAFLDERGDDPKVQAEAAKAQKRAGDILKLLGEHERAEKHYREAVGILNDLRQQTPEVGRIRYEWADTQRELADLLAATGEHDEALEILGQALDGQKQLVTDFPNSTEYRELLGQMYSSTGKIQQDTGRLDAAATTLNQGKKTDASLSGDSSAMLKQGAADLQRHTGQLAEAEKTYREALKVWKRLSEEQPDNAELRESLGKTHFNLGIVQYETGRFDEAEKSWGQVLRISEKLTQDFPAVPEYRDLLVKALGGTGSALNAMGRFPEAENPDRRAVEVAEQLAADFSMVPKYRTDLARAQNNLGNLLYTTGRTEESEEFHQAALKVREQLVHDYPAVPDYRLDLSLGHYNLADLMEKMGRHDEAEKCYRAALEVRTQLAAEFPTVPVYRADLAKTQQHLGAILGTTGRADEGEKLLQDSLKHAEELVHDFPMVPGYRDLLASILSRLAELLTGAGRFDKAEKHCLAAIKILETLTDEWPDIPEYRVSLAISYSSRAQACVKSGQHEESTKWYEKAVELEKQICLRWPEPVSYRAILAVGSYNLGIMRTATRPEDAEKCFQEAIVILDELFRSDPTRPAYRDLVGDTHRKLGRLLSDAGRPEEALASYQSVIEIATKPDATLFSACGNIYLDGLGQYEEAVAEYSKAIELSPNDQTLLVRRAIARQRAGDQAGAQADCDKLLSFDPKPPLPVYCRRASLFFALNRDEEAVAACLKAVGVKPGSAGGAVSQAGLLLLADRPDLYRATCLDTIERFSEKQKYDVARCCVLAPRAVDDPVRIVDLAKLAVAKSPHLAWTLHVLGMAHLRAGQLDEAEQRFDESLTAGPNWNAKRLNLLGLTLVHHAHGDLTKARQWYARAVAQIDQRPASYAQNPQDWVEAHVLRREAEQLLGTPDQPNDENDIEEAEQG